MRFMVYLLGFTNCFDALIFAFMSLDNLVEATSASLKPEIEHTDCLFQVKRTRNAKKFKAGRQFIDCNERDNFAGIANKEIAWPWFALLVNFNWNW
jgi:hypothetical protein